MTRLLASLILTLALAGAAFGVPFAFWQDAPAPAAPPPSGPEWHFWKLTEGPGTNRTDTASGTQPLVEYGGTVGFVDDFLIPNSVSNPAAAATYLVTVSNLYVSNAFMVWGWIKPASAGNQAVITHGDWLGSEPDAWTFFLADGTDIYFRIRDDAGNNVDTSSSFSYGSGEDYFVAIGYDGANAVLFVNGVLHGSNAVTRNNLAKPLVVAGGTNIGDFFDGRLDAVGFTNGAPTQAQVDYWYNSTSGREFP